MCNFCYVNIHSVNIHYVNICYVNIHYVNFSQNKHGIMELLDKDAIDWQWSISWLIDRSIDWLITRGWCICNMKGISCEPMPTQGGFFFSIYYLFSIIIICFFGRNFKPSTSSSFQMVTQQSLRALCLMFLTLIR